MIVKEGEIPPPPEKWINGRVCVCSFCHTEFVPSSVTSAAWYWDAKQSIRHIGHLHADDDWGNPPTQDAYWVNCDLCKKGARYTLEATYPQSEITLLTKLQPHLFYIIPGVMFIFWLLVSLVTLVIGFTP